MPTEVLENFVLGISADSKDLPSDFTTPSDAVNLRTDRHGFLIARQPVTNFLSTNSFIEGLAVIEDQVFFTSDNQLYVSFRGNTIQTVVGADDLSGRLSIVTAYQSFAIIADEYGNAYRIDISDASNILAEPLSLPPPPEPTFTQYSQQTNDAADVPYTEQSGYKLQYVNSEGNASAVSDAFIPDALPPSEAGIGGFSIKFYGYEITVVYPDWDNINDVNTIRIYRSTPGGDSDYRLINEYVRTNTSETQYTFRDLVTESTRSTGASADTARTGYPEESTSLIYYKGLLYATCGTSLRWCNLDDSGTPDISDWPAANSVERRHVDYAVEVGDVLMFGDTHNSWSLTHENYGLPYIRYVGNRGATNTHATRRLQQGWGFISEDGMYVGDSQSFQKISEPIEREWTEKSETLIGGCVTQLPNDDIHFSIETATGSFLQYVAELRTGGGVIWNRWSDTEMLQSAILEPLPPPYLGDTIQDFDSDLVVDDDNDPVTSRRPGSIKAHVYFIDGSRVIKELQWESQEPDLESRCSWDSHKIYLRDRASGLPDKRWRNLIVQGNGGLTVTIDTDGDSQQWVTTMFSGQPTRFPIRRIAPWLQFKLDFWGPTTVESVSLEYDILKARLRRY